MKIYEVNGWGAGEQYLAIGKSTVKDLGSVRNFKEISIDSIDSTYSNFTILCPNTNNYKNIKKSQNISEKIKSKLIS